MSDNANNLPSHEYTDFVTTKVTEAIDARYRHRFNIIVAIVTVVAAIAAILGYQNILSNVDAINQSIDERLTEKINGALLNERPDIVNAVLVGIQEQTKDQIENFTDAISSEVEGNILLAIYLSLSNRVHLSTESYRTEDDDLAIAALRALVASPEITSRREFILSTENLVDSFHSAFSIGQIDEIFSIWGDKLVQDRGTWVTLITHYGMRICNVSSLTQSFLDKFEKIANLGEKHQLSEQSDFFTLALDFRKNRQRTAEGKVLVQKLLGGDVYQVRTTVFHPVETKMDARIPDFVESLLEAYNELEEVL